MTAITDRAAIIAALTDIQTAVHALEDDRQQAIDEAVAAQKAADAQELADVQAALDQATADRDAARATVADLTSQIADLQATIADLQRQLDECQQGHDDPPPEGKTLFGALAGILKGSKETKAQARGRVCALYGVSALPVERLYLATDFTPLTLPGSAIATFAFPGDLTDVAAGAYTDRITAYAAAWQGPGRLWLGMNHEPDQDGRPYTPAQFAAGAAVFAAAVRAAGNPLVSTTVVLMSWTLTKGDYWKGFYDGVDVDVAGWDGYFRPTTQRTAEAVYGPCRDASASIGKPWLIGETSMGAIHNLGSMERDSWVPIAEADWTKFVSEGVPLLRSSGCVAATWFETDLVDGDGRLSPHPEALALWAAAVQASA